MKESLEQLMVSYLFFEISKNLKKITFIFKQIFDAKNLCICANTKK